MSRLLDLQLPASLDAPSISRREIRSFAAGLDDEPLENLILLVSELVTNSVLHAGWAPGRERAVHLKAWIVERAVRVTVGDSGSGFVPRVAQPEPTGDAHRGLWFIDTLADAWGTAMDEGSWSWFEFHGSGSGRTPLGAFLDAITDWPLRSKDLAWSMAAFLGVPTEVARHRLSWTTPQGVATILCPDRHAVADGEHRCRGLIEDRSGRWWLETMHSREAGARREPVGPAVR